MAPKNKEVLIYRANADHELAVRAAAKLNQAGVKVVYRDLNGFNGDCESGDYDAIGVCVGSKYAPDRYQEIKDAYEAYHKRKETLDDDLPKVEKLDLGKFSDKAAKDDGGDAGKKAEGDPNKTGDGDKGDGDKGDGDKKAEDSKGAK